MALILDTPCPHRFTDPDVRALDDAILTAYRLQARAVTMIQALEAATQRSASMLEQWKAIQNCRRGE